MNTAAKPGLLYWIVTLAGLVWLALNAPPYIEQMNPSNWSQFPYTIHDMLVARPMLIWIALSVALFGGMLGCVLMLLRQRFAPLVLGAAFVCCAIRTVYFIATKPSASNAPSTLPVLILLAVLAVLFWYARKAQARGWLTGFSQ